MSAPTADEDTNKAGASGHEQVSFETIENLTIKDGQLYWKKQKLKTETQQRLIFSVGQKALAIIVSLAAVITPLIMYFSERDKICKNTGDWPLFCPLQKQAVDDKEKGKDPDAKGGGDLPGNGGDSVAPRVAYAVFFANGSPGVTRDQQGALNSFLSALSMCSGLAVDIRGFVSSARYAHDNERKNLGLGRKRAEAVFKAAKSAGVTASVTTVGNTLQQVSTSSGFKDADENGARLFEREAFNRRVEIWVTSYGDCQAPAPAIP